MTLFNYRAFAETPLAGDPFQHVVVEGFIAAPDLQRIGADFPAVPGPGSHPPSAFALKGHFAALMAELAGEAFRKAVETKFAIDLSGTGYMATIRGEIREKDGAVHTDSTSKLITVLLYLNDGWAAEGGRLRLLRSQDSLDDPVREIEPTGGTLLVFRRSDTSWHGHKPYAGKRRAIQANWVVDSAVAAREQRRHLLSTRVKQVVRFLLPQNESIVRNAGICFGTNPLLKDEGEKRS
jgi:SM-20-related protein